MTWQTAIQIFTSGLAGVGIYFIYDLVSEFKNFKKDTGRDIDDLQKERSRFESAVNQAKLDIGLRVNDMKQIHLNFVQETRDNWLAIQEEMQRASFLLDSAVEKVGKLDTHFQSLLLAVNRHEKVLKSLRIELDNITIFKGEKKN